MKQVVLLILAVFLLITIVSCEKKTKQLTLEKTIELSQKGNDLTWSDFAEYESIDFGSGLYILRYGLSDNDNYYVLMGGASINEAPLYIRLIKAESTSDSIDIRTENINEFISQ